MLPISKSLYTQFLHFGEAVHISQFMPFYSVSQAVFLIFCFRWRVLQGRDDVDEEANDDPGLNATATNMNEQGGSPNWTSRDILQQLIVSPLNPLRISTSIVHVIHVTTTRLTNSISGISSVTKVFRNSLQPWHRRRTLHSATRFLNGAAQRLYECGAYLRVSTLRCRSSVRFRANGRCWCQSNKFCDLHFGYVSICFHRFEPFPQYFDEHSRHITAATVVELDGFLPFGLYELSLTRSYIGIYRVWDAVKIAGDEDEDTESDEDKDKDEEIYGNEAPSRGPGGSDGFG